MERFVDERLADEAHQANAKLVFHAELIRDASGSRIYLQVQHSRRPRNPLARAPKPSGKDRRSARSR